MRCCEAKRNLLGQLMLLTVNGTIVWFDREPREMCAHHKGMLLFTKELPGNNLSSLYIILPNDKPFFHMEGRGVNQLIDVIKKQHKRLVEKIDYMEDVIRKEGEAQPDELIKIIMAVLT